MARPVLPLSTEDAREGLQNDLDLLRSLVHSWGNLTEGSVEQATAIRNSSGVLQGLLNSAQDVINTNGA